MQYVLIALFLLIVFFGRIAGLKGKIDNWALGGTGDPLTEETRKEWYDLSRSGKNPMRVIRLAAEMAAHMEGAFFRQSHLASSFYSQVKHLRKKLRIPSAVVFYWEAWDWAAEAFKHRQEVPLEERKPIQLEVLGAPAFGLACLPIIGIFFRDQALQFLKEANNELLKQENYEPLMAALIWAKIWRLTGDEMYRARIQASGINRNMDENQLGRIAKHLNLKTNQQLFKFCNI